LGFDEFLAFANDLALTLCWGKKPDARLCLTCRNARTFLQPQLNKACLRSEIDSARGDTNPKDFILTFADSGIFARTIRVNKTNKAGEVGFDETLVFPTRDFPSDHALVFSEVTWLPLVE